MTSEPACDTPGQRSNRNVVQTLGLCLLLAVLFSLLFALTRGEFVTGFHKACLERYSDAQPCILHQSQGTAEHINPLYSGYMQWNHTALVKLGMGLVGLGLPYPLAVNLVAIFVRAVFGIGISWLIFAATRKRSLALLGVLLAYCFPSNAAIYGHTPTLAIAGFFTTSLFLVICSLCLLGYRRLAVLCWLFQLWAHPTTFVCWSPVFVGLFLSSYIRPTSGLFRWIRPYLALLVLGPPLAGLAAGLAESAGLLPFKGDEYYWALVRIKANHSVFLNSTNYALPLHYFSQAAALLILACSAKAKQSPLRTLNMLCAFLGLGIGLMYLVALETHFSVLVNLCLPLRFECVMYPLIVANLLHSMFCLSNDRANESAFATGFGALLMFPSLKPLLWACSWATGLAWFQAEGPNKKRYLMLAVLGAVIVFAYLILVPSNGNLTWNLAYAGTSAKTLAWLILAFAISLAIVRTYHKTAYAMAGIGLVLISPRIWVLKPATFISEVKAIVQHLPEASPEKQACDWINTNMPVGTPVLVSQNLNLHKVTHIKTSINKDIVAHFLYAPNTARKIADQIKCIYDLDVLDIAARSERFSLFYEDWYWARQTAIDAADSGKEGFQYIVEPAEISPTSQAAVVFKNDYVRVYSLGSGDSADTEAVVQTP